MVQQDHEGILPAPPFAGASTRPHVLYNTDGDDPQMVGDRRICTCIVPTTFSIRVQHRLSTSLFHWAGGGKLQMDPIPTSATCRWSSRADAQADSVGDPDIQFGCSDWGPPRTNQVDATKGRTSKKSAKDKGTLATKTFQRFACQTQFL